MSSRRLLTKNTRRGFTACFSHCWTLSPWYFELFHVPSVTPSAPPPRQIPVFDRRTKVLQRALLPANRADSECVVLPIVFADQQILLVLALVSYGGPIFEGVVNRGVRNVWGAVTVSPGHLWTDVGPTVAKCIAYAKSFAFDLFPAEVSILQPCHASPFLSVAGLATESLAQRRLDRSR